MGNTGVIDQFLGTFTRYIDSGFGLLGGEVAFGSYLTVCLLDLVVVLGVGLQLG